MKNSDIRSSALTLAVLGMWMFYLIWDAKLMDYLAAPMVVLIFLTALVCIILAQVVLSAAAKSGESVEPETTPPDAKMDGGSQAGWGLVWFILPLLIGFLFP